MGSLALYLSGFPDDLHRHQTIELHHNTLKDHPAFLQYPVGKRRQQGQVEDL